MTMLTATSAESIADVRAKLVCDCVTTALYVSEKLLSSVIVVRVNNIPLNAHGQVSTRGQKREIVFSNDRFLRLVFCTSCLRLRLDTPTQVAGVPDNTGMRSVLQLLAEAPGVAPPVASGVCVRSVEDLKQLRTGLHQ